MESTKRNRRPSTVARDRSVIDNHILPMLGDAQLSQLRPLDIERWIGNLTDVGYSPATIRKAYQLLANALTRATSDDLIPRSPCRDISLPKAESTEMRFLDAEEISDLAEAAGSGYRALTLTAGFTGLRLGELAALRLDRLNLLRRTLRVEETLTEVRGHLNFGPPKTNAARRTVSLPPFLCDEIAAHIARHPNPDGLVFGSDQGQPLRRTNFRRRIWIPAVRASVGEPCRFHDLRHSHVALLIRAGQHPKVIAARLGHTSVRTVLDVYGHIYEGLDEAAADALNDAWEQRAADSTRTHTA